MEFEQWVKRSAFTGLTLLLSSVLPWTLSALVGQTYAFQHFTDRDGLPSRYLYDLVQAKEGHIWLTGEAGMVWFDGKSYQKPAIQSSLQGEVIKMYKDNNQSIWMQDLGGGISLYKDGHFRRMSKIQPSPLHDNLSIYGVNEKEVWLVDIHGLYCFDYSIDSLYKVEIDTIGQKLVGEKVFHIDEAGNVVILTEKGYYQFEGKASNFHAYQNLVNYESRYSGFTINGRAYIIFKDGVYTFEEGRLVPIPALASVRDIYHRMITKMRIDSRGDIWFLTRNGLVQYMKNGETEYSYKIHLDGEVIGSMLEDYEGNLWFTTEHNGLYKLASTHVETFSSSGLDKQLRFVKPNRKKELVLGFDNNEYKVLDGKFKIEHEGKLFAENFRLYDYEEDREGNYYFISSYGLSVFNEGFTSRQDEGPYPLKAAVFSDNGALWIGAGDFVGRKVPGKEIEKLFPMRSYAAFPVSNNDIWFGTLEGPIRYKDGRFIRVQVPELEVDIRDVVQLDDEVFCFASQKTGLFIYDAQEDSVSYHLTTKNGLSSDFCSNILVDENFIWLSTKNGLNRINRSDFAVTILGVDQGIPSNEINGISKVDGVFYLATNKGLAFFREDIALNKLPPRLELAKVSIAQKDTTLYPKYDLSYADNNIRIQFNAITFKDNRSLVYEYKMEGIDPDWNRTDVGLAQYPSMPPGNYTFQARAKTINTNWSVIKEVEFRISAPIWKQPLFIGMGILFGLSLLWLGYEDIKRRGKQARDLKASQLTALRAQMNPHFVFNALNSIQDFIVKRDIRSTNRYLSQFARLMRNVLNISDKKRITLKKEIETLKLYLSLESLRFGAQFTYEFEVKEDLDLEALFLPPMLLQPFVENAIKHGLMHKEGEKRLYLRFFMEDAYLVCEIEDNGIGREKSMEIRKNNPRLYPSKSTSLSRQRLELFNSAHKENLLLQIDDLVQEGAAIGTKVSIKIHTQFNKIKPKKKRQTLEV